MNTKAVKSFGLALIVAVGVLALLLATGTFSPQKVGAQETTLVHEDSVSVTPSAPAPGAAGTFTVTFHAENDIGDFDRLTVELEGFDVPDSIDQRGVQIRLFNTSLADDKSGDPTGTGFADDVSVLGNVITLEIYDDGDDATKGDIDIDQNQWVDLVFRQRAGLTAPAEAGTYAVSVAEETNDEAVRVTAALSLDPTEGGSGTDITVSGKAFANGTGSLYSETLVNPDANNDGIIDTIVEGTADTFPSVNNNNGWGLSVDGGDEIDFNLRLVEAVPAQPTATPPVEGAAAYYVAVEEDVEDGTAAVLTGTDANVEALGYTITYAPATPDDTDDPAEGTPTLAPANYTGEKSLKDVTVDDGAFSTTIAAADLKFDGSENMSYVRIVDANGDVARARFQVTGTTSLGSDSVGKGNILKISLSNWIGDLPNEVKIGGVTVAEPGVPDEMATEDMDNSVASGFLDEDGDPLTAATTNPTGMLLKAMFDEDGVLDFYVKVSGKVGLGTKTVVLFHDDEPLEGARASVAITASDLTVSPSTAVVGREVTITGSGFTDDVESITVGGEPVCGTVADCGIEVASGGRVVAAFDIPNETALADADDYDVVVTDSSGRIGMGTVTIPGRTITVDPTESRIGSSIDLTGTGWPTGTGANLVRLYYDGIQYAAAVTGNDGTWSASIDVPTTAGVGATHDVEAKATVGDEEDNVTQKADHATPDAVVTLSAAQAQRGSYITVSGENFHTFEKVEILIGDSDVTPSPLTTDGDGSFSGQVLVPGLALGNKNLKVSVNDVPVVEFLEIIATPATPVVTSTDPADVFADLIEAGVLDAVWVYNNDDGKYRGFIPGATDTEMMLAETLGIALTEVNPGDIGWINLNADATFQGKAYTAGWKLVTIN